MDNPFDLCHSDVLFGSPLFKVTHQPCASGDTAVFEGPCFDLSGANLEFDLLSYSSSDISDWDYPVFFADGTYYGLNLNGTLGGATAGGNGNGGTIDNANQVGSLIHYVVDLDALTGNGGPHTIGFGVHSVDGGFGAGIAVYDTVLPAGGSIDPCPGQTCDEVGDVCIP